MSEVQKFNPEAQPSQSSEHNFEMPAKLVEKTENHPINVERAARLLRLFDSVE